MELILSNWKRAFEKDIMAACDTKEKTLISRKLEVSKIVEG